MEKGYIQIYTGDGKGKTTAALGLCLRAVGRGCNVKFIQFLKGQETGEQLTKLANFDILRVCETKKFIPFMSEEEISILKSNFACELETIKSLIKSGEYDIIVLDEILGALTVGMIKLEEIMDIISLKPKYTELVLTGRDAPKELIEKADLVTEMRAIKHYMDQGVKARKGIEY